MRVPFVDLKAQYQNIKGEIDKAIADVIESTLFIQGGVVKEFEESFAQFCGASFCVGVGNGTDALYLALKCSGVEIGYEVVVPANSFIATSEAVTMTGARVVFCDVEPITLNLDVTKLEQLLNSKTRAIIPVHLYGHPAEMKSICEIAKKKNIVVVEDAAQAHGAEYMGKRTGILGDVGCFSFYPGKNLGAYGDGGAVVTNDRDMADKIRMTANHGGKPNHLFEGINSRLDSLQAAIVKIKLKYLEKWNEDRRKNADLYNKFLEGTGILIPFESPHVKAVYHLYVIRVLDRKRDALKEHLAEKNISTGIHYPITLPNLRAYSYLGYDPKDFPIATHYSERIISLPMFPELKEEQIEYVANNIKEFFRE